MTLKSFLREPNSQKLKHGAMSRCAEYIGVSVTAIRKWYRGEWKPNALRKAQLAEMFKSGIDLNHKKTGRCGRKRK